MNTPKSLHGYGLLLLLSVTFFFCLCYCVVCIVYCISNIKAYHGWSIIIITTQCNSLFRNVASHCIYQRFDWRPGSLSFIRLSDFKERNTAKANSTISQGSVKRPPAWIIIIDHHQRTHTRCTLQLELLRGDNKVNSYLPHTHTQKIKTCQNLEVVTNYCLKKKTKQHLKLVCLNCTNRRFLSRMLQQFCLKVSGSSVKRRYVRLYSNPRGDGLTARRHLKRHLLPHIQPLVPSTCDLSVAADGEARRVWWREGVATCRQATRPGERRTPERPCVPQLSSLL